MFETEGFFLDETNGLYRFRVRDRNGDARVVSWRCPPERWPEFGVTTKVRIVLDGDHVESVEVIPL